MPHLLNLAPPLGGSHGVRIWHRCRKMFAVHFVGVRIFSSTCPSTPRNLGMQDEVVYYIDRMLDVGNSTFI